MGARQFKIRASAIGQIMTDAPGKGNVEKLQDTLTAITETEIKIASCSATALKTKAKLEEKLHCLVLAKAELQVLIDKGIDKELGQTCKTYLNEWYVKHWYGRSKDFSRPQIKKGNLVENDAILLLSDLDNEFYIKNEAHFENDYCKGTPDIIENEKVIDIKSSFDLFTFTACRLGKLNMDYYWQLQGYMWLTGLQEAELSYCLISTPISIIQQMLAKAKWQKGYLQDLTQEEEAQIFINANFDDIAQHLRAHRIAIQRNDADIERIAARVVQCREYLETIWEVP